MLLHAQVKGCVPVPFSSEVIGVHASVGAFDRASLTRDGSFVVSLRTEGEKMNEKRSAC